VRLVFAFVFTYVAILAALSALVFARPHLAMLERTPHPSAAAH